MDIKLPKKIIALPNADKVFHEKWTKNRDILNIPHPYRAMMLGPPNSGKSTVVKNLLLRADPPFERIYLIHCDPEYTKEYDDIPSIVKLDAIPDPTEWPGDCKSAVVLDDLEFKRMSGEQHRCLDRLFGFVSTHKNLSVLLCSQDPFNVPPIVRRCSNLYILWNSPDVDSVATASRKSGFDSKGLKELFKLCNDNHDSIWIDRTSGTKNPLRLNGYKLIKIKDDE